jgi:hypothetical protein
MSGQWFRSPRAFLQTIPAMIAGLPSLDAVFVTYKTVTGRAAGVVPTDDPSLRISIASGDHPYSLDVLRLCAMGLAIEGSGIGHAFPELRAVGGAGIELGNREADAAQAIAERRLATATPIPSDAPTIIVVYAGVSAFERAVTFTSRLRGALPRANVVVVTCDCEMRSKERTLQPMLDAGELRAVVTTPQCGGRDVLREILDAIVGGWSSRTPHAAASMPA